eukprot:COSAG06_NODE_1790_length_8394_cov_34.639301_13_plen_104_part_00
MPSRDDQQAESDGRASLLSGSCSQGQLAAAAQRVIGNRSGGRTAGPQGLCSAIISSADYFKCYCMSAFGRAKLPRLKSRKGVRRGILADRGPLRGLTRRKLAT